MAIPEAIMAEAIPVAAIPAEAMAEAVPAAALPIVAMAEAVPAVAMAEAAVAEAEVTLRELQEALEEEMLTRQSLSRELDAIRTANRNFARCLVIRGQGRAQGPVLLPQPLTCTPSLLAVNCVRLRPATGTSKHWCGSSRSGWNCCSPGEQQASAPSAPFPRVPVGRWTPGGGRGAQAGARRATRPMPLSSPSSCHGGSPTPGHGSTFPCKTPLIPLHQACAPSADPAPIQNKGLPASMRLREEDTLHAVPRPPWLKLLNECSPGSPQIPSRPPLPFTLASPNPLTEGSLASLGSDRVTCPFSLQLDGPPAVALGQCPLVGPGPLHRRHLLLPARVCRAVHRRPPAAAAPLPPPPPRSAPPETLALSRASAGGGTMLE